jgi:ankyrin repeat protein
MSQETEESIDIDTMNVFFGAIVAGDVQRVVSMLESKQVSSDVSFLRGQQAQFSALGFAAYRGQVAIVDYLLEHGASIDGVMPNGLSSGTACHFATVSSHGDVVDLLIARGANLALLDGDGCTALDIAAKDRIDERITLALVNAGAPLDNAETVMNAASLHITIARALIARGVDFGPLRDNMGNTVCHVVCQSPPDQVEDLIDLLVKTAGIDVNARCSFGFTCAYLAAEYGHGVILRRLIMLGASIAITDPTGNSPLHVACKENEFNDYDESLPCAALLLAAGADVDARNERGQTACHVVNMPSIVPYLLAEGANSDIVDDSGMKPLQNPDFGSMPSADEIDTARRRLASHRLEFVRDRALQVCIGLQPLQLSALQTCEILLHACGPAALGVAFHHWWQIATLVKHFRG